MGQEISHQTKCNNNNNSNNKNNNNNNDNNNNSSHNTRRQTQITTTSTPTTQSEKREQNFITKANFNEKFTGKKGKPPKDLIYTPASSISTASSNSTDDAHYRQRQKYNLSKQTYEKTKVAKKLSFISTTTSATTTTTGSSCSNSDYQNCSLSGVSVRTPTEHNYENIANISKSQIFLNGLSAHQRKNSQSTDSGIYYSTCHCSSASSSSLASSSACSSSAASTSSGFAASSVVSQRSNKSLAKQKHYLSRHLYIKSYLDILEEDEKARARFQAAKPGGIRNYTPKILAETKLSVSAPLERLGFEAKQRASGFGGQSSGGNKVEDPWI